ncbi:MAG: acetyl-CoA carboxylase biotin carboxylase subunit [Flavobacteriales bacterium]|nr:acetyl-CoA carboxylase biotin carboxylase subunit [Flavobacteriales bacterium]
MKKILIANRGEIALRIMKTIKRMGIRTVAVYSTADRDAPHVKFADEAVHIGDNPSNKSYLLGDKIIEKAVQMQVDGIHPGYGFLSENETFSKAVEDNGMTFIGPGHKAIRMMGDKLAAKDAVKKYNIPMVPGIDKAITEVAEAKKVAEKIGYPVLIKAAAGGGGKGMRIVNSPSTLEEQMERAISEALSAFGDGSVFIEKYVTSPRHIEFQILADNFGNVVHLFERECSIQRRHQKVIEEAPSCILSPELRNKMGEAAIKVAESCDYRGAGTVEFLMDAEMNFYFLEMNTRLQVEHPVTEFITGLDLVEEQIKIARGEQLTFQQKDLKIDGHAVELRVYAEDSLNDFLPNVGVLNTYEIPKGDNIRLDDGYEQGMEIPIYYDPMISKLITYGKDREEAIQAMIGAIDQYRIEGVETTLPFGKFVLEHEAFRAGKFDTHFVSSHFDADILRKVKDDEARLAALLALKLYQQEQKVLKIPG